MNQKYSTKISISSTVLLGSMVAGLYLTSPTIIGIGTLFSFIAFRSGEKTSNIYGKTRNAKILNSLIPNLIEFSALATTTLYVPEPLVSAITLGITGLSNAFTGNLKNKLGKNGYSIFGRTERVSLLAIALISSYFNSYLLMYGLIVLSVLVLADLVYTIYQSVSG